MAARITKRIKNDGIYLAVLLLSWLVNALPRRAALAIGALVGKLAWGLLGRDREQVHANLQIAYGTRLSADERELIGRQFFINSGKNLVDVLRLHRHFDELRSLVTVEGLEYFDEAYRRGNGLFGVTGHLGNFELLAAYTRALGYDVAVIGREMYDVRLDRLLVRNRESVGLVNIATTDSVKRIIEWLRRGKVIGVLIDIDSMRVRSVFVPFFGRPANTPIGQSVIAMKTGAALVPGVCVRDSGDRYKVIFRPPVQFERTGDLEKDAHTATLLCTKQLEDLIDLYRDQWIWIHNRWNTKPENRP